MPHKAFFDTSVLLAAFIEDHEHHQPSFRAFVRESKRTACCASHSLAELYATATRLPGRHRLTSDQAMLLVENVAQHLKLIHLEGSEYLQTLKQAAANGIAGGTIYDALLAACAQKGTATVIYTWNVEHFRRVQPSLADAIRTPG
jgi:predicted nucleic acid-binding protein